MKCKKCKSIEATIHVADVGDFCLDCHNDYMAELLGVSKMDDFSKIISGYDADGLMHRFEISNMIMPGFSVWKAEEMELRRVSINPDVIIEHFERTLSWFLEGDFLSYKHESACGEALFERIDKLELLFKYGNKEEAVEVGNRMKKRLRSVENDTDDFPNYLLKMIDQVIGTT